MTNALAQVAKGQAQASQAEARLAAEEAERHQRSVRSGDCSRKMGDPPALLLREPRFTRLGRRLLRPVLLRNSSKRELNLPACCWWPWRLRASAVGFGARNIRAPFDARVVHGTVDLASTRSFPSQHSRRVATDRFCGSEITVITSAINTTRCRFRGQNTSMW